MIRIIKADGTAEREQIASMRSRAAEVGADIERAVGAVMQDVREKGFSAVEKYSLQFDRKAPYEIGMETLEEAYARCTGGLISAMEHAAANIRDYNEALLATSREWISPDGGIVGRVVRGLTRVGLYVPGGTAAYPSSVLMNAIPAKVAGVERVVMVTPPQKDGLISPYTLAAAKLGGVDEIYMVGGAQAVAALAFGTESIPRVDKITGPGNIYVANAKREVFGHVGIDMVAGPSEVLVVADSSARPHWLAADMLSQAEHDMLASAILLTDDITLAEQVQQELEKQCSQLPKAQIAGKSLMDWGAIVVVPNIMTAVAIAYRVAPEHLELCVRDPWALLPHIRHAGAIFMGQHSPEPVGDYFAGPNHVLPTLRTPRFSSALSVQNFCKKTSIVATSPAFLLENAPAIASLARLEGLEAHARSVEIRSKR